MVALGLCLTALGNFAFGFAGKWADMFDALVLTVILILARALGGIGAALSEAGCLIALSSSGWGEDLGKVLSMVEMTTGLGAALGAALSTCTSCSRPRAAAALP